MGIGMLLILITVWVSYMGFRDVYFFEKYNFNPYRIVRYKEYYRLITHGFLHSNQVHLFFNMLTFFFAQQSLEIIMGRMLVPFYLLALVVSSSWDLYRYRNEPYYRASGASGAVSAAIFAMLVFAPWNRIYLFFFVPMSFLFFAIVYLGYSLTMLNKQGERVAHLVHILGAIFGIVFTLVAINGALPFFIQNIQNLPSIPEIIFGKG